MRGQQPDRCEAVADRLCLSSQHRSVALRRARPALFRQRCGQDPLNLKHSLKCLDSPMRRAIVKCMLNDSRLDQAFAALSDPTRRTMLARLSQGSASVSELAKPLSMSLPAVLQHLS